MTRQIQKTSSSEIAVQSGRDTVINQSVDEEAMKQIMESIADQIPKYAEIARQLVDQRIDEFEKRIIDRFVDSSKANSTAFKDPDFQYLVGQAQHMFVRTGDEVSRDTLIDLIARRSLVSERNRQSLVLNQAVETAAVLTKNEYAELSIVFLLAYTKQAKLSNYPKFIEYLRRNVDPLINDISDTRASYEYLVSQACCTISIGSKNLRNLLVEKYGGLMSGGFELNEYRECLSKEKREVIDSRLLLIQCLHDASKYQVNGVTKENFEYLVRTKNINLSVDEMTNLWNLNSSKFWDEQEIIVKLEPVVPNISRLFELWKSTPLENMILSAVGIAIAYSNLIRVCNFDADLSIWIN